MIVVDASILAYLYSPGENTTRAEVLMQDDPDWAAPVLWWNEYHVDSMQVLTLACFRT